VSTVKAWFPYRKGGGGLEIFGFPHAGAGSTVFAGLREALAQFDVALVPAVLPGRERRLRERPHCDMPALLADFEQMARASGFAPFEGDYALLGHCSGALVAYEIARLLERAPCAPPRLLVVSGSLPPPMIRDTGTSALSTPELFARTADLGGTPPALLQDPDFLDMIERPLRADWTLFDRYVHRPAEPLSTPVLAVRGAADPDVSAAALQRWRDETTEDFSTLELPAGHWPLGGDGSAALADAVPAALERTAPRA
jgi:surfactin synthase thioesterase subunit